MQNISNEYDIGIFQVEDIKTKNLSLKINEHNTTILGNITDSDNNLVSDLEVVLYRFEANHELVQVDRVKTDALGYYKFNNVIIGTYIVKDNEFDPEVLNVNQRLANSNQINRLPWRSCYNVANGYLQDGARLDGTRDRVLFIGGPDNGSSSIYVYAVKDGEYDVEINYIGGLRSFKVDVNNEDTGKSYKTPKEYFGTITITLTLILGYNLLKFYGADNNFSPTLGIFTLTSIEKGEISYNLTRGVLENGAKLDATKNMVMDLGGPNNGSARIIVTVNNTGYYLLTIKFRYGGRSFLVDANNVSTGEIYITQATYTGSFSLQVYLKRSINEIKFYGIDNRKAPNLGSFDLVPIDQPQKPLPPPEPIPVKPTPQPPKKTYSVAKGVITKGAILGFSNKFVLYLGGYNQGTSTITVNVENAGSYNIVIDYVNRLRPFKMSVNGKDTGEIYRTPSEYEGKFTTTLNLVSGDNILAFYGVFNGHGPYLGEFTLELVAIKPPTPPVQPQTIDPQPEEFSVANGVLENGAILSSRGDFVYYLGGNNYGSSTVTFNVDKAGRYNISVTFQNGYRQFKMDVNDTYTGSIYTTPTGHIGTFSTIIDLNLGTNKIKFYGVPKEHASGLGKFTLDFVVIPTTPTLPPGTYDTANGVFENGATLDVSTNLVNNLGGRNDGATTVTVNVDVAGSYIIEIKYLAGEADRNFMVDINGRNAGIFNPPVTNGNSLADIKVFPFQVDLSDGDNLIKFHGDGVNQAPLLSTFVVTSVSQPPHVSDYSLKTLSGLSYSDLVSVLKTIGWYDIPGLFDFSGDSYNFFNDDNRIQAVIDGLKQSGQLFTAQNEQGIDTLVEVLRAGFYLGSNNSQLSKLYEASYRNKCWPAIKSVVANSNFKLGTPVQDKVVKAIGKLIGNATADVEIVNSFAKVLKQYKDNIVNFKMETSKNQAIEKIAHQTNYFLEKEVTIMGNDARRTSFYTRIEAFTEQIEGLAEEGIKVSDGIEWLVSTFLDITNDLARFRRTTAKTLIVLNNCLNSSQRSSALYLQIAAEIKNRFNSRLPNGGSIDYNQIIETAKQDNLPNTHRFDDGAVIVKVGDQISLEMVKKLYWAAKEVKAQFVRICGNDVPLDVGNPDDVLTMIIYNNPEHYKLNYQLYGYSTNNGGIYIENIGTFFTFDREVPRESIYSLEELFRHEYVHYLQGRFLVSGIGFNSFSRNLTWFTEGIAEFFAGATRTEGVKPREAIVRYMANSTHTQLSISDLFNARYGSFNFYKYGFAFSYCMYSKNIGQFLYMASSIRNNDSVAYENYIQTLRGDNTTNIAYEQTIRDLIQSLGNLTPPITSNNYLLRHSYMTVTQIYNDILSILYMSNITTNTKRSDYFETVLVKGTCSNGVSIDQVSDWNAINRRLDGVLTQLDTRGWTGYSTFTAYFTNYRVDAYGNALFDIAFHGILRSF